MNNAEKEQYGTTVEWLKELSSSLENKYKETLSAARSELFDIFSLTAYNDMPDVFYGQDVLGNNIAIVWSDGKKIKVEPLLIGNNKRVN